MKNIALQVINHRPQIERLFEKYGIISPVTIENVNLALQEECQDFENELVQILQTTAHNSGEPAPAPEPKKGAAALEWINTIGGLTTGLTGAIVQGRNQPSTVYVQPAPAATPKNQPETATTKIFIAVAVVVLLAGVAFFMLKGKK